MKTQINPKNILQRKAKKRPGKKPPVVSLAHSQSSHLRHLRLVEHKHTGKLVHYKHTSHLSLVVLLIFVGIFMYVSAGFARVRAEQTDGSVSIGVIVPGPAPTIGATITSPKDGATVQDRQTIMVAGTCASGTFVVLHSNNELVGSGVCTPAGIFAIQIQVQLGVNTLSALNYDNLDQPGPNTPLVRITVMGTEDVIQSITPQTTPQAPVLLPVNPSFVPGLKSDEPSCDSGDPQVLTSGGVPRVAVACIPRFIQADTEYALGVMAWGGVSPYAVDIGWGNDEENTLLSMATPGKKTVKFSYASAGVYTITFRLKDQEGKAAYVQTAVQTSGETKAPLVALTEEITQTSWLKTPVPLYLISVALTLGFWGGDLFDRNFGARKVERSSRRPV